MVFRLGWLAAVLYTVRQELATHPTHPPLVGVLLTLGAAAGWFGWSAVDPARHPRAAVLSLALLGGSGGLLAGFAPIGLACLAVAGLGAGAAFSPVVALGIAAIGPVALATVVGVTGGSLSLVAGGLAAVSAGLVGGSTRRQERVRVEQAALLAVERDRAEVQQARADLLADRNRLAREVHDVLAHTLGAVAMQLEALDAVLTDTAGDDRAPQIARRARRLVVDGLTETRLAVRALRDEPVDLIERLTALAAEHPAELRVTGRPRPLKPATGLALYRSAQEALTNAVKHAPGAPVTLSVDFAADTVTLTAVNGPGGSTSTLAETGGGYGLQGIGERVRLLGGRCCVGPSNGGWTMLVEVPT